MTQIRQARELLDYMARRLKVSGTIQHKCGVLLAEKAKVQSAAAPNLETAEAWSTVETVARDVKEAARLMLEVTQVISKWTSENMGDRP